MCAQLRTYIQFNDLCCVWSGGPRTIQACIVQTAHARLPLVACKWGHVGTKHCKSRVFCSSVFSSTNNVCEGTCLLQQCLNGSGILLVCPFTEMDRKLDLLVLSRIWVSAWQCWIIYLLNYEFQLCLVLIWKFGSRVIVTQLIWLSWHTTSCAYGPHDIFGDRVPLCRLEFGHLLRRGFPLKCSV